MYQARACGCVEVNIDGEPYLKLCTSHALDPGGAAVIDATETTASDETWEWTSWAEWHGGSMFAGMMWRRVEVTS
jgi:hypothetical protein